MCTYTKANEKARKAEFTTAYYARIYGTTVKALRSDKPPYIPRPEDFVKIEGLSKSFSNLQRK